MRVCGMHTAHVLELEKQTLSERGNDMKRHFSQREKGKRAPQGVREGHYGGSGVRALKSPPSASPSQQSPIRTYLSILMLSYSFTCLWVSVKCTWLWLTPLACGIWVKILLKGLGFVLRAMWNYSRDLNGVVQEARIGCTSGWAVGERKTKIDVRRPL